MSTTTTGSGTRAASEAPAETPAPTTPSWGPLLVLLAGIFICTLDFFIVNVAIPDTQRSLHASSASVQWVVAGYGLAVAAGLVTAGRLGDMFGRRRMFALGLALFTLASAACGLAPDAASLITARVVQGGASALLMPQVLGIVNVVYTGPQRMKAFTAYGVAMGFAGVFGQLIGGVLIQVDVFGLDWRAIYWINVPVGIVALLRVRRVVPEVRAEDGSRTRLDLTGATLVTLGLVAVTLPLVQGRSQGWPLWTWLSFAASAVLLALFVASQFRLARRGGEPLVDPAMFKERAFSVGIGISLVYSLAMASFFLVLALFLQFGHGMTALKSGLLFIALGAGYFASSAAAEGFAAKLGRQVLAVGGLVQAAGLGLLELTVHDKGVGGNPLWLAPGMAIAGFGMGLVLAPMAAIVLSGVSDKHAGAAAGLLSTGQQVGGALGVALVGIVFYDKLGGGMSHNAYATAFNASLTLLAVFCVATAALTQALPGRRKA